MFENSVGLVKICGKCCGKPAGVDDDCSGSQYDGDFILYLRAAMWLFARAVTSLNNPALKPTLMLLYLGFTNLLTVDNSMSARNRCCLPRGLLSSRQSPDGCRDFAQCAGRFCENVVVKFQNDFGGAMDAEPPSDASKQLSPTKCDV